MNELITIENKDGVLLVNSREVAERFEKQHKDVLETIRNLAAENSAVKNICIESNYENRGKQYPEYLLTRDGFSLLAMGFNGSKALEWKLKFLEAFNQIEQAWNTPELVFARALKLAEKSINNLKLTNSHLTVQNAIMQPKAEYFDELVDRNLLTNLRDTAKELKVPQKQFITFLELRKYVYRDSKGKLKPFSGQEELFELKETINSKTGWTGVQTLITPKGRETFRLLLI